MKTQPTKAVEVETKKGKSFYPESFAGLVAGRTKRKLGDIYALTNFGVNLTHLDPGAASALYHYHTVQDEFVYVTEGTLTLLFGEDEFELGPGDCMGFKAGTGIGHQLINRSSLPATYIEIGDRKPNEKSEFPRDDIVANLSGDGSWIFTHKNGEPY